MKKIVKRIRPTPLTEKCVCGMKVLNHHWLCDKCYKEQKKLLKRIQTSQFLNNEMILKKDQEKYGKWVHEHYYTDKAKEHWANCEEHQKRKNKPNKKSFKGFTQLMGKNFLELLKTKNKDITETR